MELRIVVPRTVRAKPSPGIGVAAVAALGASGVAGKAGNTSTSQRTVAVR